MGFKMYITSYGSVSPSALSNFAEKSIDTPTLIGRAVVHFKVKAHVDKRELIAHAFAVQSEQLYGLFDNSLIGRAYKAYQWDKDMSYNKERRQEIYRSFFNLLNTNTFFENKTKLYLALPHKSLNRWIDILQSIISMQCRDFVYKKVKYTVNSNLHYIKSLEKQKTIQSDKTNALFRSWFVERKKRQ